MQKLGWGARKEQQLQDLFWQHKAGLDCWRNENWGASTWVLLREESNILDHIECKGQWFGGAGWKNTTKAAGGAFKGWCQWGVLLPFLDHRVRQKILAAHARKFLIYSRDDSKNPLSSEGLLETLCSFIPCPGFQRWWWCSEDKTRLFKPV